MQDFDIVIRGGLLVLPDEGVTEGQIGVRDGKIAAILSPTVKVSCAQVVDAESCYVMPGLIDPHTHFGFGSPERDFVTESRSAAVGGVTTVLSYYRADNYLESFPAYLSQAASQLQIDFSFHFGITSSVHVESLRHYAREFGVNSFKFYLMYKGAAGASKGFTEIDDGLLFAALQAAGRVPGTVMGVHCENVEVASWLRKALQAEGRNDLAAWDEQSPDYLEAENVHRVCYFAAKTDAEVYIVHVSSKEALDEVRRHKARYAGIHAETCPHYLLLRKDLPLGASGKVNPPLRSQKDVDALWEGVLDGTIDTIGSDHVPRKRSTKNGGVWKASAGFPGVATMLPLLMDEGVAKRGVPVERIAALTSMNVARLFRLKGKGNIAAGYDADLVVVDPHKEQVVDSSRLESHADYSVYDGMRLRGWPRLTMVRGTVVARDGVVTGKEGHGRMVPRWPLGPAENE